MLEIIKNKACLPLLDFFIDSIRSFLRKAGASEQTIFDIILSSEEILVNVMSYAYPKDKNGEVEVTCELADNGISKKIKVTFTDEGKFFDALDMGTPDTAIPIEKREIGGLGIYLVKTLMDDVSYIRRNNQNILTIAKSL
ncbi:MAG: ATP-binding protein [Lentisphaerota bacterium]